jgi:hypothetical protein
LGQIYFDLAPRRLTLDELNAAYPNMVDGLVQHEGIGVLMAYNEYGEAIAFGKKGARNLVTNQVTGQDPLTMYGNADLRAAQLKRLSEFPHNGDLTVISTYYPDGTVAAMEELVGNHGGIGGEQTDAFIFHPDDFPVPETTNSVDVFAVLNARRGIVAEQTATEKPEPVLRGRDAWTLEVLWKGLARPRLWLHVAARALLLERSAFRQAAFNPYLTAPALVIALVSSFLMMFSANAGINLLDWVTRIAFWLIGTLVIFGAARLLRGTADFTTTLRVAGFAQVGYFLLLVTPIQVLAAPAQIGAFLITFLATWIGVSEAHKLTGWRAFLLPVVTLVVALISAFVLSILARGLELTMNTIGRLFGLNAQ